MMLRKKPKTYPIIDPPRIPIIQSKNSFEELRFSMAVIVYKEKNMIIIRIPKIRPVTSPHLAPSKILSAALRRSFSNFPIPILFLC